METHERWWLFRRVKGCWQQRSRVLIPNGNASRILHALVRAGGWLSREEADRAFDVLYSGVQGRKRSRTYTDALAKVKLAVRESISECGRFELASVPNPIPFEEPGWRAEVEVGIAVLDDDGRLVLNSVAEST